MLSRGRDLFCGEAVSRIQGDGASGSGDDYVDADASSLTISVAVWYR